MLGFYLADARAVYVPVVDLIYSVALYNTKNFLAHLIAPNAGVMQKGKYGQARFFRRREGQFQPARLAL